MPIYNGWVPFVSKLLISLVCWGLVPATLPAMAQTGEGETVASEAAPKPLRLNRLQGRASLRRNRYVVGATVLVRPADDSHRLFVTATDDDGRFRIDGLENGTYNVEFRREGLETVVKNGIPVKFPARAVIEVTMVPSHEVAVPPVSPPPRNDEPIDPADLVTVRGQVVHLGEPMADVRLRFVRRDGRVDPLTAHTSADGIFGPSRVPVGPWRLQASLVGFLPIWISVDLDTDSELTVSMVPQPVTYSPSPLELMPEEQPILPESRRAKGDPTTD